MFLFKQRKHSISLLHCDFVGLREFQARDPQQLKHGTLAGNITLIKFSECYAVKLFVYTRINRLNLMKIIPNSISFDNS